MKTKVISLVLASMLMIPIFTSCSKDDEPVNIRLSENQQIIAKNANEFAFEEFKAANTDSANILVAPFSTQATLSMLANGARGETLNEILKALNVTSVSDLNNYYKTVTSGLLNADKKVSINFANGLWTASTLTPKEEFTKSLNDYYGAKAASIDFTSSDALKTINDWVSNATGGRISKLLAAIDSETQACIVNAIAFEGGWKERFDAKDTKESTFRNVNNETESCMMMKGKVSAGISVTDYAELLELRYGNGSFAFDIIQPRGDKDINEFISTLSLDKINEVFEHVNKYGPTSSKVRVPKFEATYSYELSKRLMALGVNKIFGAADFGGIADKKMVVNQYMQQLRIKVDEEGTKVATSTEVVIGNTAMVGDEFIVDSPFIYLVRERSTGAILLIGKVQTMAGMQ